MAVSIYADLPSNLVKELKRAIRDTYKLRHPVRTPRYGNSIESLMESEHIVADPDAPEYWSVFGFVDPEDATDEEIQDYFDDMRVVINSPYDCTGRAFTSSLTWHRNPSGLVSYVHRMAVDI